MQPAPFRNLPSTDRVLALPELAPLARLLDRPILVQLVRDVLDAAREEIRAGGPAPAPDALAERVLLRGRRLTSGPRPVLNATGVILHTNLGRAPLSSAALEAVALAAGYSDLEYDLGSGERGSRHDHVRDLISLLTGAEAAHTAVNNAAAVLLALTALVRGKEVLVARGQAVEIGGGFRVPVILRQSGAKLVEVGTTNRTRLADYEESISGRTGAILHVHPSNFRLIGFAESPDLSALADLARRNDLPLIVDNGSGSLLDTGQFGLRHEPMPREALEAGANLVTFSGDKLLGGPQVGILAGDGPLIRAIARHPLARAVRPDKVALAALAATLQAYARGEAVATLPVWRMIAQSAGDLAARAGAWQRRAAAGGIRVDIMDGESAVGGGSLPGETLPTSMLVLPARITAARLRRADPPVIARTRGGRVLLDLRTVHPDDEDRLLAAVQAAILPETAR